MVSNAFPANIAAAPPRPKATPTMASVVRLWAALEKSPARANALGMAPSAKP